MALTIHDLFASPDHYLHSYDGDAALFVPMDRAAYCRSIFLDGRIQPADDRSMAIPVAALQATVPPPRRMSWIFHVAHCGSTLLARALDRPDANLVLREPLAMRQMGVAPDRMRLALAHAMASKRYAADLPTIVKANVPVNFILADIARADPEAGALFLHLGLRDYLLAILRSDDHRKWLNNVTRLLPLQAGLPVLSDAERAAALWLAQIRAFAMASRLLPNARSLDAELFFAHPAEVLNEAAAALGAATTPAQAAEIVAGPLFATYSKDPAQAFDNADRLARRRASERMLGDEIAHAEAWVARAGGADDALVSLSRIALLG